MKQIYFDNAATTAVTPEVFAAMKPYFLQKYGNASEPHFLGSEAKLAVEQSREKIAKFFGAESQEIIFTSSATESINFAHKGLIEALSSLLAGKKPHILISAVEHKAIIESCSHLEKLGLAEVDFIPVDQVGLVKVNDIQKAIKEKTVLVSVMYINNEVGTIQPIPEIGVLIKKLNIKRLKEGKPRIYFHTDATQAVQYLNCNVGYLGVDLLSFTGHKIYAPKGVGGLYIKKGTPLVRQQDGGGQEGRLRAGTENVPYIVALGKAVELSAELRVKSAEVTRQLRDRLIEGVLKIPGVKLTGHPTKRAPHIASVVVDGVEGEAMALLLSEHGIAVSTGSACTSAELTASHVLTAMGYPAETSHGSLRLSLGKNNTKAEVDYFLKVLPGVIAGLREMAPDLRDFKYEQHFH